MVMVTILFAVVSILIFRFRSRTALELKLVPLQHQLAVLRRQRPPSTSALIPGSASMGVDLPDLAPGHRRDGTAVPATPTQNWLARQMTEAFPWDTVPRYLQRDREQIVWSGIPPSRSSHGDHGSHHCAAISVAEPVHGEFVNPHKNGVVRAVL
jgi:hypothetical protein